VRAKGMTYDTGFVRNGEISRARFDPEAVRRELAIIRDDLHCTAVQLIGGDPERLGLTASYATELGLEVWFSPYPLELTTGEICRYSPTAPSGRSGSGREEPKWCSSPAWSSAS
jgi:hypothetical protein